MNLDDIKGIKGIKGIKVTVRMNYQHLNGVIAILDRYLDGGCAEGARYYPGTDNRLKTLHGFYGLSKRQLVAVIRALKRAKWIGEVVCDSSVGPFIQDCSELNISLNHLWRFSALLRVVASIEFDEFDQNRGLIYHARSLEHALDKIIKKLENKSPLEWLAEQSE